MEAVLNELVSVEDLKVRSGPEEGGGQNRKGQFLTRADRGRTVPVSSFWGSRTTAPSSLCGILLLVGICTVFLRLTGVVVSRVSAPQT